MMYGRAYDEAPTCGECRYRKAEGEYSRCTHPELPSHGNDYALLLDALKGNYEWYRLKLGVKPSPMAGNDFIWPARFQPKMVMACEGVEEV